MKNNIKISAAQFLDGTDWLKLLSPNAQRRVIDDARVQLYRTRDVVAHFREPAHSWIGVADGLLKVSSQTVTGKAVMFTAVPAGSWVGEGSVIKRELRRYELTALRDTAVVHIPRSTFMWMLDTSLEFSRYVIDYLNERAGQFIAMLETSRIDDPVRRIASSILILFNPVLYRKVGPFLGISQAELGELVGLSRATTNAALKYLKEIGIVRPGYGGIVVLDIEQLREFVEHWDSPTIQCEHTQA